MESEDCDIDTLLSLINSDEDEPFDEPEKPVGQGAAEDVKDDEEAEIEAKLKAMHEEMEKLKNKLQKKKTTTEVDIFKGESEPVMKMQSSLLAKSGRTAKLISDAPTTATVTKKELTQSEKENLLNSLRRPQSEVHAGDTDSSDDEERRTHESQYNDYGKSIKKIQKKYEHPDRIKGIGVGKGWNETGASVVKLGYNKETKPSINLFTCDYSGIRVLNPIIGKELLAERMQGRKMVRMSSLENFLKSGDTTIDWVTMGVLINKSEAKTSQKGNAYSIWRLCDLNDCSKILTMFLFGNAYKDLWKTAVGTVIGILNPGVMKDREGGKDKASLSIDTAHRVMILGTSRDFGTCKGINKKDSRSCTNIVNKSSCEFCVYHVQAEYKKTASKRSDLQSTFSGPNALRNKVLGKDEVFYGGRSFLAVKETKPKKTEIATKANGLESLRRTDDLRKKDEQLLASLTPDYMQSKHLSAQEGNVVNAIAKTNRKLSELMSVPTPGARNLLKCLSKKEEVAPEKPKEIGSAKVFLNQQLKERGISKPEVGKDLSGSFLEFEIPTQKVKLPSDVAKLKALELLRKKGPVQKVNPNAISKVDIEKRQEIVKRKLEGDASNIELVVEMPQPVQKKSKLDSLKSVDHDKLLNATSAHSDLLEQIEDEAQEQYFSKLEKKEQLEKKMEETFEVKTKAVYCRLCKYTAFSAADRCRNESHPLKVIHDATKRFFSCKSCKNRTIALDRYPHHACKKCGSSSWERASMHKAKDLKILDSELLSVRGDEINHLSSINVKVNLNI